MNSASGAAGSRTCPAGHLSPADDYCDTCGLSMVPGHPIPVAAPTCVVCGVPWTGRYCEECGHDTALPAPGPSPATGRNAAVRNAAVRAAAPVAAAWSAVVRADRAWFDEVARRKGPDAAGLTFPRHHPERCVVLTGPRVTIGRYHPARGTVPEIDLSGPPPDPGVSARHALLLAQPDGGWEVVDLDSTNGTSIDDSPEPIPPHTPVALVDGACIRLGAWTTITVSRARNGSADLDR